MSNPPGKVAVVVWMTRDEAEGLARYHFEGKPDVVPPTDLMAFNVVLTAIRDAQRTYFRERDRESLNASVALERELDAAVRDILDPGLFR